jgi:hypothetical protein
MIGVNHVNARTLVRISPNISGILILFGHDQQIPFILIEFKNAFTIALGAGNGRRFPAFCLASAVFRFVFDLLGLGMETKMALHLRRFQRFAYFKSFVRDCAGSLASFAGETDGHGKTFEDKAFHDYYGFRILFTGWILVFRWLPVVFDDAHRFCGSLLSENYIV